MGLKIGRNDPCPCGSGNKFKSCCEGRVGDLERGLGRLKGVYAEFDQIYRRVEEEVRLEGKHRFACGKGCWSCCYIAVQSTRLEGAYALAFVASWPAPRAAWLSARLRAYERAMQERAPGVLDLGLRFPGLRPEERAIIPEKYASARVPCPFLSDGACSIYAARPLACRKEHSIDTSDACGTSEIRWAVGKLETPTRMAAAQILRHNEESGLPTGAPLFAPLFTAIYRTKP